MSRSYELVRRSGTEAVIRYVLEPGATGQPIEPANFPGAAGAQPDSFGDLSISFAGVGIEHAALVGSDDGGRNWFDVVNTAGRVIAGGVSGHVKTEHKFYAPAVGAGAPAGTRVIAEIHLANR